MKIQFNPKRDYQQEAVKYIVMRLEADDTPTSTSGARTPAAKKTAHKLKPKRGDESFADKYPRLLAELEACFGKGGNG